MHYEEAKKKAIMMGALGQDRSGDDVPILSLLVAGITECWGTSSESAYDTAIRLIRDIYREGVIDGKADGGDVLDKV